MGVNESYAPIPRKGQKGDERREMAPTGVPGSGIPEERSEGNEGGARHHLGAYPQRRSGDSYEAVVERSEEGGICLWIDPSVSDDPHFERLFGDSSDADVTLAADGLFVEPVSTDSEVGDAEVTLLSGAGATSEGETSESYGKPWLRDGESRLSGDKSEVFTEGVTRGDMRTSEDSLELGKKVEIPDDMASSMMRASVSDPDLGHTASTSAESYTGPYYQREVGRNVERRWQGRVKFFDAERGYGFIIAEPECGRAIRELEGNYGRDARHSLDVFFHYSDLGGLPEPPEAGDRVLFTLGTNRRGTCARGVIAAVE